MGRAWRQFTGTVLEHGSGSCEDTHTTSLDCQPMTNVISGCNKYWPEHTGPKIRDRAPHKVLCAGNLSVPPPVNTDNSNDINRVFSSQKTRCVSRPRFLMSPIPDCENDPVSGEERPGPSLCPLNSRTVSHSQFSNRGIRKTPEAPTFPQPKDGTKLCHIRAYET